MEGKSPDSCHHLPNRKEHVVWNSWRKAGPDGKLLSTLSFPPCRAAKADIEGYSDTVPKQRRVYRSA